MKKITLSILVSLLISLSAFSQNIGYGTKVNNSIKKPFESGEISNFNGPDEECDDIITCDNLENGVFINGGSGQKAAIDIPIDSNTEITINQIKVTLSSALEPGFVHFKFYKSNDSIPSDLYREVLNTTIIASDSIGYEPRFQFVIRNITLQLEEPIILNGAETIDRFWMSPISDADAWATTDGVDNGASITGKAIVIGGDGFDWFELGTLEGLYEIDAECALLGVKEQIIPGLSVFPNPTSDKLNIQLSDKSTIVKAEIFNIHGQKIKEFLNQNENLDVSDLSNGLYLCKIQTVDNQVFAIKFVR
ncbi:T9SS type A sorting domain-containing protein [Aequorivita antarctica]|uniref:T9SS type A sorting domain-containing protein n=1 Tax=Aequorivita antarctica TaxID=153266 RepID=A0A5C6Z014_9FLAO|nr:T9SS type A sorting domain-containing protein [Aequorivita antarctica]TXD73279.1 T9SS type A sorting domain-containing protein [Aequorivita antarctica]SRX76033.1 hypothetical protein AEQU3_03031 [Aequorivita antarctica]